MIQTIKTFIAKHKFVTYLLMWQISSLILALCVWLLPNNIIVKVIFSNIINGCLFYPFGRYLFNKEKNRRDYLR
jgi:hypothetical protein